MLSQWLTAVEKSMSTVEYSTYLLQGPSLAYRWGKLRTSAVVLCRPGFDKFILRRAKTSNRPVYHHRYVSDTWKSAPHHLSPWMLHGMFWYRTRVPRVPIVLSLYIWGDEGILCKVEYIASLARYLPVVTSLAIDVYSGVGMGYLCRSRMCKTSTIGM